MCVLIFSTTFVWNISHYRKNWSRYYHKCPQVFRSSTRYTRQTYGTWNCLKGFREKKTQILNFVKIRPVGAKQFHADERTETQTGMTKPLFEITRNRLKELWNPQPRKPVRGSGIELEIFRIQRKTTTQRTEIFCNEIVENIQTLELKRKKTTKDLFPPPKKKFRTLLPCTENSPNLKHFWLSTHRPENTDVGLPYCYG